MDAIPWPFQEAQGKCVHVGGVRQTQRDVSIKEVGVDLDGRLKGTPGIFCVALVPVNHALHPIGLVVEGGIAKHGVQATKGFGVLPQVNVHLRPSEQAWDVVWRRFKASIQVFDARLKCLRQVERIGFG